MPEKNPDLKENLKEDVIEHDDFFEFARTKVTFSGLPRALRQ